MDAKKIQVELINRAIHDATLVLKQLQDIKDAMITVEGIETGKQVNWPAILYQHTPEVLEGYKCNCRKCRQEFIGKTKGAYYCDECKTILGK